jgi:hypothetical protein
MLIFREPTGLPLERVPDVALANWFSMRRYLGEGGYDGLPGLIDWAETRPDLGINLAAYSLEDFSIQVGDWQYVGEKIVQREIAGAPDNA